jgi:hypothetical protein
MVVFCVIFLGVSLLNQQWYQAIGYPKDGNAFKIISLID